LCIEVRRGACWLITEKPVLTEKERGEAANVNTRVRKSTIEFREDGVVIHTMALEADQHRVVSKSYYRREAEQAQQ
jgi:hypothetical protein